MSAQEPGEKTWFRGCALFQLPGDDKWQIDCVQHPDFYPLGSTPADARRLITEHVDMHHRGSVTT